MPYLVSDIKSDIQRKLHGTSLSKVSGINNVIYEAGKNLLTEIDPFETKRVASIENAIYDSVTRYATPLDLKGDKVIDIFPNLQIGRKISDKFNQTYSEGFNANKADGTFTVESENDVRFIDMKKQLLGSVLINGMDAITGNNGTWAAGGTASNLVVNSYRYVTGGASLQFDVTSGAGYIENSTMTQVDLTNVKTGGAVFAYVFLPSVTGITSVGLRWGNDTSNYYSNTVTTDHNSLAFQNGWNLLRFDWSSATQTGTVDVTKVDYLRLTINATGTVAAIQADSVVGKIANYYMVRYYSEFLYRNASTGVWQEQPVLDSDVINLSNAAYNIHLYECMRIISPQVESEDGMSDLTFYEAALYGDGTPKKPGLYKNYRDQYKSESKKKANKYYRMP